MTAPTDTRDAPAEQEDVRSDATDGPDAPVAAIDARPPGTSGGDEEPGDDVSPSPRLAVALAFPLVAAALMVGGIFEGISPRIYAGVAALLGLALAFVLARLARRPLLANVAAFAGLFAIGLLMVVPEGLDKVTGIRSLVSQAATEGDVLRPPVEFQPGWMAIVGWLMAIVGFVAGWLALAVRRPSLGLLLPLPVAAFAGISVPEDQQVASGIAVLVLFAIGLGLLASEQSGGPDERPPLSYELRKAAKALPVLGAVTVALALLAQTNVLFPPPLIDPTKEPQRPKTVPLSEVEDRVLFEVDSIISGPWRVGTLDVYDGVDWRLPAFAEHELVDVPRDGIVDEDLQPGVRATFTVAGLGGTVLPGLPNTVGIVARGPELAYDQRIGSIRLAEGTIEPGLTYTVAAANLPSADQLRRVVADVPARLERFTEMPAAPQAVVALLQEADGAADNAWDRFDYLRTYVLDNVVATGLGTPVSIPPSRVQEILGETKEASPYEIVALQAMLARWAGIPARIGYGYDGGDLVDDRLQVRPRHGATFVEVYFPGYKWLPVIGTPKQAEPTVTNDPNLQQLDPAVLPSDDVAVQLFFPVVIPPGSDLARDVAVTLGIIAGLALLVLATYVLWPLVSKARARSRRRAAAARSGPRARVALAYAEWRDAAADLGYDHPTDTPLMFVRRFVDDPEHTELAWLTTRALWGDLRTSCTSELAAVAEELSRSLRRRLAATQPTTLRIVAALSRTSMRHPYTPDGALAEAGASGTGAPAPREEERDAVPVA